MKAQKHSYTLAVDGIPKCDCYGCENLFAAAQKYADEYPYEDEPVFRAYDWCESHTFTVDMHSGTLVY